MMFLAALWLAAAAAAAAVSDDDPGFGGAAGGGAAGDAAAAVPDDEACVVKGDDGVWRSCADAIAAKKRPSSSADDVPARDESPEAQRLRKQAEAAEAAAEAQAAAQNEVQKKTQLEIDLEKAHLDPAMPLLAVRVEKARAQMALDALEKKGVGGKEREAAQARLDDDTALLDDIERIAVHRMDVCLQRQGKKPIVKNYRMTAAGPILLTLPEIIRQIPQIDPVGCERIMLVDDKVIEKVKREHELHRILATRSFGYFEVDERRKLEKELKALDEELAKDATPALSVPGARDPYGARR